MEQKPARTVAPPSAWRNIPVIRGAAIAAMIATHSVEFSLGFVGVLDERPKDWPSWQTAVEVVVRALGPQCIPVFVFASGFFMFRFARAWGAAWASARSIGARYLMWALPGYAFLLLVDRSMAPTDALWSFVDRGPYYGTYWFLVLLFQLCLVAPLLARWVDASPRSALVCAIALQAVASSHLYWRVAHEVEPAWRFAPWRVPFFLAGMIASSRGEALTSWLARRRAGLLAFLAVAQVALVLESWKVGYAQDKLSLVIASLAVLAWGLSLPAETTRVRSTLASLGLNSMAVLLASDLLFAATGRVLWHAGEWMGLAAPPPGVPPAYLRTLLIALPFLLAGLVGPLAAAAVVERLLGKPARRLVFG